MWHEDTGISHFNCHPLFSLPGLADLLTEVHHCHLKKLGKTLNKLILLQLPQNMPHQFKIWLHGNKLIVETSEFLVIFKLPKHWWWKPYRVLSLLFSPPTDTKKEVHFPTSSNLQSWVMYCFSISFGGEIKSCMSIEQIINSAWKTRKCKGMLDFSLVSAFELVGCVLM